MENDAKSVRGDLIKWARTQQSLTMRWVRFNGGPAPGYQSEVEHDKKAEVGSGVLKPWTRLLGVTEAFVRGEVPRYHLDPQRCYGMAGEIGALVLANPGLEDWAGMSLLQRVRRILCLIAAKCDKLPRVVLAYVLGLPVKALDEMMLGSYPITLDHMKAVATLTTLPEQFFRQGILQSPDANQREKQVGAVDEQAGLQDMNPDDLNELMNLAGILPELRAARQRGKTPAEIAERISVCLRDF